MSDHPNGQPANTTPVRVLNAFKPRLSLLKSVSASETLAEILEVALADTDAAVQIISNGSLHYNPIAAATTANAKLPADTMLYGGKTLLDTAEFYSAAAQDVGIIVYEVYTGI